MPSIRRPWPVSRRDTDGLQANSSSSPESIEMTGDVKTGATATTNPVEAEKDLQTFKKLHQWDFNLESSKREAIENAVKAHDIEAEIQIDQELEENSPYPEVASAVRNIDEDVPANTIRAWVIGLLFTTIGSGLNMLFSLRNPQITITSM